MVGHHADFGTFASRLEKLVQVVHQECGIASGAVFQYELKSARSAHSLDRRRREGKRGSLRKGNQLQVQLGLDHLELLLNRLSVFPWIERYIEERVVGVAGQAEQAESHRGGAILDTGSIPQDIFHDPGCFRRALYGGGFRQLHLNVHIPLVFVGQEACRNRLHEEDTSNSKPRESYHREETLTNESARHADIELRASFKPTIEPCEEFRDGSVGLFLLP